MMAIKPFNNCYIAHMLIDGSHANIYGRGHPADLLLKKNRGRQIVVLINWWRISEARYRMLEKGAK